jgi:polyhydroxyalkanoate synthesis regulator phasin
MPSPKKVPSEDGESLRDQLRRLLNPLDVMVITRDRLQDTLDDAVQRGRMTRDDATELVSELMRRGRRQTEDVLAILDDTRRTIVSPLTGDAFPISGYDDLTAAEVVERMKGLEPGALREIRDYERRNANRKTILSAVEQKLQ